MVERGKCLPIYERDLKGKMDQEREREKRVERERKRESQRFRQRDPRPRYLPSPPSTRSENGWIIAGSPFFPSLFLSLPL